MKPPTPPRSILDPAFRYTPAVETDLRALFDRIRPGWQEKPARSTKPAPTRRPK